MRFEDTNGKVIFNGEIAPGELAVSAESPAVDPHLESNDGPVEIRQEKARPVDDKIKMVRQALAESPDFKNAVPDVMPKADATSFTVPISESATKRPPGFLRSIKKYAALAMVSLGIFQAGDLKAEGTEETTSATNPEPEIKYVIVKPAEKKGVLKNYFKNLAVVDAFKKKNVDQRSGSGNNVTTDARGNTIINYTSTTYEPNSMSGGSGARRGRNGISTHSGNSYGGQQGLEVREFNHDQIHTLDLKAGSKPKLKATSAKRNSTIIYK